MRKTERLLRIKKCTHQYEKYWAPFENKEKIPTDMRNTERHLRLMKNDPTIYEKYWAPFENKKKTTFRYEKYWAPFEIKEKWHWAPLENKEKIPTDMKNTERLLRLKKNDKNTTIYYVKQRDY